MIYQKDIRLVRFLDELTLGVTFYLKEGEEFRKCDVPSEKTLAWLHLTDKYFREKRLFLNTKNPGKPVAYNSL
jgi:hypothetical protein